jgi:rhamnopyranosyl-N-acetylglucosaminyl-diphospho-decaprenol beta-1,3/1,4-galactofuranosyltransferase
MSHSYGVVIVTFNRRKSLQNAIDGVIHQTIKPAILVVVDNHSADSTEEFLKSLILPFSIKIIRVAENIGHGAGLAVGLKWLIVNSDCKYFIFLEDDSVAKPELSCTLIAAIKQSGYYILCLDGLMVKLGKRYKPELRKGEIVDVDFGLLDGVIVHRGLIEVVGFPKDDFFMMCDDLEYSKRIRKIGYKIGCIKTEFHEILHLGGGVKYSRSTLWRGYYQARNSVHILKEYFSLIEVLDFAILEAKRLVGALGAKDRVTRIGLRLLGIWHGIIGKKGKTVDPDQFR